MINKTQVWVALPSYAHMHAHSIKMNVPSIYDYVAYHKALLKSKTDTNMSQQDKFERVKDFIDAGCQINHQIRNFKKFAVLPDKLYCVDEQELPHDYEYAFTIQGGAIILNEACANILKQFRLGDSTLTPLKILDVSNDGIWYSGGVYFFNLCEHRNYVKIPQSHDKLYYSTSGAYPTYADMNLKLYHNVLEIDKSALDCDVDIWHDRSFKRSIFLSDKLREALIYANMLDKWNMKSCNLV